MKRTNLFLSEEMLARLKKASLKTGMTVSEFIRRAVEEALKKMGL